MSNFTGQLLAELVRAGIIESVHNGHLALINSDGTLRATIGDVDAPMYPRSSIKSFQAAAMVRNGLKLTPRQLAIVCASHSGTAAHFEVIESILYGAGLTVADLRNTADLPYGRAERQAWGANSPTQLAQGCSGKHAGMLATCVVNGWDTKNYLDPEHPLQIAIRQEFQLLIGEPVISTTIDGCGAPLFAITTRNFALGAHKFRISLDPVHQEIVAACIAHPNMVAGTGRLTTTLMEQIPGLFVKDGAEAVELLSLDDGRACVFKISDGSERAVPVIVKSILKAWDIDALIEPVLIKGGSQVTGEIRASHLVTEL
ncbi:MAG: asparaginase [Actinomycetota bacterium]